MHFFVDVAGPTISAPDEPQTVESYDGQSVSASVGDSIQTVTDTAITLHCAASGVPEPSINWFKDGQLIVPTGRIAVYENGSLSVSEALASDSGQYSCEARNIFGENTMTSTVTVAGMCPLSLL